MSSVARRIITRRKDVHKDSITLATLPDDAPAPARVDRLPDDLGNLHRYCDRLAERANSASVTRRATPDANMMRAPRALRES